MALLHMALQWRPATDFFVLTVDHGLRPEAKREAEFVKDYCLKAGAAHRTLVWAPPKGNISQARARDARHRMLATALRERGGSHLLLGHTLDDQYETVHMRAARGETGLAGMRALSVSPVWPEGRDIYLARPLLGVRRSDLRRRLRDASVDWVEDPSNANQNFERVRTRHVLAQETASAQNALDARLKAADKTRSQSDRRLAAWLAQHVDAYEDGLITCQPVGLGTDDLAKGLGHLLLIASGTDKPAPLSGRLDLARDILAVPGKWRSRTLGGAWLAPRQGLVQIARDPGLAPLAPDDAEMLRISGAIWDGRFEIGGIAPERLKEHENRENEAISALAKRSYPVFLPPETTVNCLARGRLDSVIKVLGHETCVYAC